MPEYFQAIVRHICGHAQVHELPVQGTREAEDWLESRACDRCEMIAVLQRQIVMRRPELPSLLPPFSQN